jgi:hypothetical protein
MQLEHLSTITTYKEACQLIAAWGILPLSRFIPDHPSLDTVTRPEAWHTGAETDPWLWRDRLASDGIAAYGRFLAGKPLFISRELFPLVRCLLGSSETIAERYEAGTLSRETVRLYEFIAAQAGIDVKALRRAAGLHRTSDKNTFDRALIDLQSTIDIVISGITARLNAQGNKSGWNSTCYTLAEHWMEQQSIEPLALTPEEASQRLFAWLAGRWEANAVQFLRKKIAQRQR